VSDTLRPRASLSQFELFHSVTLISLTECYMQTLIAFDNIVIYIFHFNSTAILCISVLTVTFIKLLLTHLLTYLLSTHNGDHQSKEDPLNLQISQLSFTQMK